MLRRLVDDDTFWDVIECVRAGVVGAFISAGHHCQLDRYRLSADDGDEGRCSLTFFADNSAFVVRVQTPFLVVEKTLYATNTIHCSVKFDMAEPELFKHIMVWCDKLRREEER